MPLSPVFCPKVFPPAPNRISYFPPFPHQGPPHLLHFTNTFILTHTPFPIATWRPTWATNRQVLFQRTSNSHIYQMLLIPRHCEKCLHIQSLCTDSKRQRQRLTLHGFPPASPLPMHISSPKTQNHTARNRRLSLPKNCQQKSLVQFPCYLIKTKKMYTPQWGE